MRSEIIDGLDDEQWIAMMISMHVRNKIEDFHSVHIPDELMPELNSTIRYAIFDFFESIVDDQRKLAWLAMTIPDYWEIPGRDPKPTFTGEYLWQGKPIPRSDQDDGSTEH